MRVRVLLFLGFVGVAGCNSVLGIQDHELASSDGSVPSGSNSGSSSASASGSGSSSGTDLGQDAGPDAANASTCTSGATACNGNTPQRCVAGGWQLQTPCGGSTPTCSNGLCGTYRTTGGIRSTAPTPVVDAGTRLVSGVFELGMRSCDEAGVCVTGGIVP